MRSVRYLHICVALIATGSNFLAFSQVASGQNKPASTAKYAKMQWEDPRKGKIWNKVNIVHIPLTAYENHILGPIKSVAYKDYKISWVDGKYQQDLVDSGYNAYDRSGHLVDQNEYKPDGTAKWNCIYKYDNNNKATEWDFKFEDSRTDSKTLFKYDDKGNQIESEFYDKDMKPTGKGKKKYDEKGNEVESVTYDPNGKLIKTETYRYDNKGFQLEWRESDGDGKLIWKRTGEYDTSGNKIGGGSYRSITEAPSKWAEKNDEKNHITERINYRPNGTVESKSTRKYDVYGNTIEEMVYKDDGTLNEAASGFFDYAYDKSGNITKQTEFKITGGKKVLIKYTQLQLTYY